MEREYSQYLDQASLVCDDMEELVDDYIDLVLPVALRERFEMHCERCASCRGLVQDIRTIIELARGLDSEPLPLTIRERLRDRLRDEVGYEAPQRKLTLVK